jgi:hypothetical protein
MTSPNLEVPHVAASQSQKVVTVNEAIDFLDRGMTDLLDVSVASGDVTLTDDQALRHAFFTISGAPGTDRLVTAPTNQKSYFLRNDTTGGYDITFKASGSGETPIELPPLDWQLVYVDGTDHVHVDLSGAVTAQTARYISASLSGDQTTNISSGDQIEFDTIGLNDGITLATGVFTLPAGGTYLCLGSPGALFVDATGSAQIQWRDNTGAALFGKQTIITPPTDASHIAASPVVGGIINPSVTTAVELRLTAAPTQLTHWEADDSWAFIIELAWGLGLPPDDANVLLTLQVFS